MQAPYQNIGRGSAQVVRTASGADEKEGSAQSPHPLPRRQSGSPHASEQGRLLDPTWRGAGSLQQTFGCTVNWFASPLDHKPTLFAHYASNNEFDAQFGLPDAFSSSNGQERAR